MGRERGGSIGAASIGDGAGLLAKRSPSASAKFAAAALVLAAAGATTIGVYGRVPKWLS